MKPAHSRRSGLVSEWIDLGLVAVHCPVHSRSNCLRGHLLVESVKRLKSVQSGDCSSIFDPVAVERCENLDLLSGEEFRR